MKDDTLKKTVVENIANIVNHGKNIKPDILGSATSAYEKAAEAVSKLPVNRLAVQTFIKYLPAIAASAEPAKTIDAIGKRLSTPDFTKIQMQRIFSLNSGNIDVQQFFAFGKNPQLAKLFAQSFPEIKSPTLPTVVSAPIVGTSIPQTLQNIVTNVKIFTKSINLPAWVLPTTFGVAGASVAGPAGAVSGVLGGIGVTKIVSPNTQILPEMAVLAPKLFHAGFEMAKNQAIDTFGSFMRVSFVTISSLTVFVAAIVFIIQTGALIVPENLNPLAFLEYFGSGERDADGSFSRFSGFCWPTTGTITQGPVGSNYPSPEKCSYLVRVVPKIDGGETIVDCNNQPGEKIDNICRYYPDAVLRTKYGCTHEIYNEQAIDIGAATGTMVVATHDGTVTTSSDFSSSYGNRVIIVSPDGKLKTLYAHLSLVIAKELTTVKAGDEIGLVGNTGNSTGSHLHYAIRTLSGPEIKINDIVPPYKGGANVGGCSATSGTGLTIPAKNTDVWDKLPNYDEIPYQETRPQNVGERPADKNQTQCTSSNGVCQSQCKRDLNSCDEFLRCHASEMSPKECTQQLYEIHDKPLDCPLETVCCYNYCEK